MLWAQAPPAGPRPPADDAFQQHVIEPLYEVIELLLLNLNNSYAKIKMSKSLFLLTTLLAAQEANAFAPSAGSNTRAIGGLGMAADAQALSDYMAKSHEEKLRAIKEVEDKKNLEITVSLIPA